MSLNISNAHNKSKFRATCTSIKKVCILGVCGIYKLYLYFLSKPLLKVIAAVQTIDKSVCFYDNFMLHGIF